MQHVDWNDIRYCLAVVREGSVTAAARKLGVNQTTVSRRITALEQQLNVTLFDRSTTGWLITPVGESILPYAEQMEEEALAIGRQAMADHQELSGQLRVTAADLCIRRILLPSIKAFSRQYPDISIDLISSDEVLDLAGHDADIAFRVTNEPPPNVVGKRIAEFAYAVYATDEVYRQYREGSPAVAGITWTGDGHSLPAWMQKGFPGMPVRYRTNSLNAAFDLVCQGHGLALLPCGLGDMEPTLRRVPCDHVEPGTGFWVLSHIDLRKTARIRIFRDFMLQAIEPYVPLLEGRMENPAQQAALKPAATG